MSIVIDGTNGITFPDAGVLAAAASSAQPNGYVKLPGGIILQWGRGTAISPLSGTLTSVVYPIAFPNSAFVASVQLETLVSGGGISGVSAGTITALSTTGLTWGRSNSSNIDTYKDYFWIAIGN